MTSAPSTRPVNDSDASDDADQHGERAHEPDHDAEEQNRQPEDAQHEGGPVAAGTVRRLLAAQLLGAAERLQRGHAEHAPRADPRREPGGQDHGDDRQQQPGREVGVAERPDEAGRAPDRGDPGRHPGAAPGRPPTLPTTPASSPSRATARALRARARTEQPQQRDGPRPAGDDGGEGVRGDDGADVDRDDDEDPADDRQEDADRVARRGRAGPSR